MSISRCIERAAVAFDRNDYEDALLQLCPAVDSTATREFGRPGRSSFKRFLRDQFDVLSYMCCGVRFEHVRLRHPDAAELAGSPDDMCALEDVLYHIGRCEIMHTGEISSGLRFHQERSVQFGDGKVALPRDFLGALMVLTACAPSNTGMSSDSYFAFGLPSKTICLILDLLWGKRAAVRSTIELDRHVHDDLFRQSVTGNMAR